MAGVGAAGLLLTACGEEEEAPAEEGPEAADPPDTMTMTTTGDGEPVTIDFSSAVGVVNYAYALEQLEAAFYAQVVASFASDLSDDERAILTDIGAHELVHADLLAALLGDMAIGALEPDFSAVDFASRDSVLQTAKTFEDLGVQAYNGAASLIDPGGALGLVPLQVAGSIVSVEARHAAIIADLLEGGASFAPAAFDGALPPADVLAAADPFIATPIMATNLPSG